MLDEVRDDLPAITILIILLVCLWLYHRAAQSAEQEEREEQAAQRRIERIQRQRGEPEKLPTNTPRLRFDGWVAIPPPSDWGEFDKRERELIEALSSYSVKAGQSHKDV